MSQAGKLSLPHYHHKALDLALKLFVLSACVLFMAACSTNPATGDKQFTALMPASQEASVGAQEHEKIEQIFGKFMTGPIQAYVNSVGQKVAKNTERPDVQYQFFVIDSPIVNAFALPGGYIYVTRGLLALANNEAEIAAVLGHEIAHVTARHSAERYSQGVITQLGAAVLGAALDSPQAGRLAGLGSELYIKSYSRSQEHQADELGVRYLSRSGYDTFAMASFLDSMSMHSNLEAKMAGQSAPQADWFSTHPQTENRVAEASAEAARYPAGAGALNREAYFSAIRGMAYGDSAEQGFIRGQKFYHPDLGFTFSFPDDFQIQNQPSRIVATHKNGAVMVFDSARVKQAMAPGNFLQQVWLKGERPASLENITVNGKRGAAGTISAQVNNRQMTMQLVAIEWEPGLFYRFQVGIPQGLNQASINALKQSTYSLRAMTAAEKQSVRPYRINLTVAKSSDSVATIASRMAVTDYKEDRFRVLNGLQPGEGIVAGRMYKIVTE